ncbi:hypothetical protein PFISCL1PPCAC_4466, partial [Pristionchus fissidentatus]
MTLIPLMAVAPLFLALLFCAKKKKVEEVKKVPSPKKFEVDPELTYCNECKDMMYYTHRCDPRGIRKARRSSSRRQLP